MNLARNRFDSASPIEPIETPSVEAMLRCTDSFRHEGECDDW